MPVPLALAGTAAAAGLAYLNARGSIWFDLFLLKCAITGAARLAIAGRRGKLNLFHLLEANAASPSHRDRALLVFEGKTWTYLDVYDRALRYGSWMRQTYGVKKGDIVAMDFMNGPDFIFVWLALWGLGAKPAFINYNLTGAALSHCIKQATTALCLIDPDVAHNVTEEVKSSSPDVRFEVFTPELEAAAMATPPQRASDEDLREDDLSKMAILIYTSGTTGLPKAAVVSYGKCCVGGSVAERLLHRGDDILYTAMPLYHSSAAILSFCATLLAGSTQALGRRFSTKTFWPEVRASRATIIQYVGETLRYLLAAPPQVDPVTGKDLDKEHCVTTAFGNGLRPDIWNRFKERFAIPTILEFYAATEGTYATWNISSNDLTAGAIGRSGWLHRILLGRNVAIVAVDFETDSPYRDPKTGRCVKVKPGEPGEMLFRLPAEDTKKRFQGYYNNDSATDAKIMRDALAKGDAWFRTGDIVQWDSDGRVYFSDRIGDTFRWKSENVSTAEVSEALGRHPAIKEANVYGVELPHHDGRAGCAAIFLDAVPSSSSGSSSAAISKTMRSLAAHVRHQLPRYARPLFLRLVPGDVNNQSQITGTNKQQKQILRQAGVRPDPKRDEELGVLYWLNGESYEPFGLKQWRELDGGRVKL